MQPDLINNLFHLYKEKTLAPFYIVNGAAAAIFHQDFLNKVLVYTYKITKKEAKNRISKGHQDIFLIDKTKDKKEYTVIDPEIIELNKFLMYSPVELNFKILIFQNAHLITKTLLNKFLKMLEEPPQGICIFFENSQLHHFLPTIESRAIHLYLKNPEQKQNILNNKDLEYINSYLNKEKDLQSFIQKFKDKKHLHPALLTFFINHKPIETAAQNEVVLNLCKDFDIARTYNRGTMELIASYSQLVMSHDRLLTNN